MEIKQSGSQPSRKGLADYFTSAVRVDPLFQAPDPARVTGGSITFEPGARTAWHAHPLGQTLIVTPAAAGCHVGAARSRKSGRVTWSGSRPGEKHRHGATAITAMTHSAIQERLDGKVVEWLEKVIDDQYRK